MEGQIIAVGDGASAILNQTADHVPSWPMRTVAIVTDKASFKASKAHKRVLIGRKTCEGYGCAASPHLGRRTALEDA